jgi:hypothetical protein
MSGSASAAPAEPSSTALLTSMRASVRQASSVHIVAHLANNGTTISLNLDMHRNGDLAGTYSQNGAPFQIISVSGTTYIKATRSFLQEMKVPSSACAAECGKWLQLTPAQASELTGDLSMNSLILPLTSGEAPATEAGSKTIAGHSAWVLRSTDKSSTLDVSSASRHYPVASSTRGSTQEAVIYSQWNTAAQPVAPPSSQVLNLNNLK